MKFVYFVARGGKRNVILMLNASIIFFHFPNNFREELIPPCNKSLLFHGVFFYNIPPFVQQFTQPFNRWLNTISSVDLYNWSIISLYASSYSHTEVYVGACVFCWWLLSSNSFQILTAYIHYKVTIKYFPISFARMQVIRKVHSLKDRIIEI